ncbi:MAG: hypothetical protein AMJ90_05095 [candidate division Zixibacteria bacterium SM23_73_2]|nr:MAG: hypothetical protein AMJ90_05095 [candidate division Zixibacteria bacterium SM23_73_2]
MNKKIFFVLFLFFILFINIRAESKIFDELDSVIVKGIHLVQDEKFDQAIAEFQKIIDFYPNDPIGYFFIAATYQTLIDNYRNENYKSKFENYIDTAIEKGNEKLKTGKNTSELCFYSGGAYGYRGIYRSFRGNWWGAFRDALKAKPLLEKALELDSTLYDAYYGLGAYHYWGSIKSKLLSWLPFIGDEREKGIKELILAVEKGKYTSLEAKYSLLRVYNEEKDYYKVLELSQDLKSAGEDDPFRLWMTAQAYMGLKRWDEALETYNRLLNFFKESPYYDLAAEVECRYWMAEIFFYKKEYIKSIEQLGFALAHQENVKNNDYAKPIIEQAKDLKKKIRKRLSSK